MPKTTVGRLAFHVHHNELMERLTEPIKARQDFIRQYKPPSERKTRLRLLRLVKGPLPTAVEEAWAAYDEARDASVETRAAYYKAEVAADEKVEAKARAAYAEALAAYNKTGRVYDNALKEHAPEIEALHRKECPDCPWDGKTIFPDKDVS